MKPTMTNIRINPEIRCLRFEPLESLHFSADFFFICHVASELKLPKSVAKIGVFLRIVSKHNR